MGSPDDYFMSNFNTELSRENQTRFRTWLRNLSQATGRDRSQDLINYDLQGYWLNGGHVDKGQGHMPDTYKKPNHPTFSNESIYHGLPDETGIPYEGGVWGQDDSYTPSVRMLQTTIQPDQLIQYFRQVEPNSKLKFPDLLSAGDE